MPILRTGRGRTIAVCGFWQGITIEERGKRPPLMGTWNLQGPPLNVRSCFNSCAGEEPREELGQTPSHRGQLVATLEALGLTVADASWPKSGRRISSFSVFCRRAPTQDVKTAPGPPSLPPIQTTNQKHVDADCSMSFQFSFQNWLHQGRVLSTHSPAPTKWQCGRLGVGAGLARSKHGLPLSNSSWQSSSVQGKLFPGTLWKFS